MELELVSISELARRRGLSKATLARRIKNGLLPEHAFIKQEGHAYPLIDLEVANEYMDAITDAAKSQEEQVKRLKNKKSPAQKPRPNKKAKPKEAKPEGNGKLAPKKSNVKKAEANKKPEKKPNEADKKIAHEEQYRKQKLAGLELDESSGMYFADDVAIEEFEGKRLVRAKDILLTNAQRYQKERASTESLKAQKLQMELDVSTGKLIDGEKLKGKIFKIGTETRDAILNVPEQFGPDLLACKDLTELQTTLAHALNKALENLGRL